ncbi:MAG: hypothetical protein RL410_1174 [Actinomycetota bacterium]
MRKVKVAGRVRSVCGRYVSAEDPSQLRLFFETTETEVVETLPHNYNVAPTQNVYVVDALSGSRVMRVVKWGLVPQWASDPAIASKLINARSDTVFEKPSFKNAAAKTRCLIPATGWYEWKTVDVDPKGRKRPFYIHSTDGNPLAFAGLLEAWRQPDGQWLKTMSIITTDACQEVAPIHDRMPVIVARNEWDEWLDPANGATPATRNHLATMLHPTAPGIVRAFEVDPAVNSIRNNGVEMITPLVGTN